MQKENLVEIQLSENMVVEIVRLLDFAALASKVAMSNPNTPENDIPLLTKNINNAKDLGDILAVSLDIGSPESNVLN